MTPRLEPLLRQLTPQPVVRLDVFEQALTHRSASHNNNERLEFLGDALLGFVIAEMLWQQLPMANEGELSRARAALVKQETLAVQARALQLGDYLRLGSGELRTGGYARDSILADAFEALLGAFYIEQGFAATVTLIQRLFADALTQVALHSPGKDPKTRLQEWLQAQQRQLPEYVVIEVSGKQHDQCFAVRCRLIDTAQETIGEGTSRRRAEQQAAMQMLTVVTANL